MNFKISVIIRRRKISDKFCICEASQFLHLLKVSYHNKKLMKEHRY